MRQAFHKAIGLFFWLVMVMLWVLLVRDHKAGGGDVVYSVQYLALVGGAVLAVTLWWIRHNQAIYRRKGLRSGRPDVPPPTDQDRLGRPIRWQMDGGAAAALEVGHLVVEIDGQAKVYRAGR